MELPFISALIYGAQNGSSNDFSIQFSLRAVTPAKISFFTTHLFSVNILLQTAKVILPLSFVICICHNAILLILLTNLWVYWTKRTTLLYSVALIPQISASTVLGSSKGAGLNGLSFSLPGYFEILYLLCIKAVKQLSKYIWQSLSSLLII